MTLSIVADVPAESSGLVASQSVTIPSTAAGDLIGVNTIFSLGASPSTSVSKITDTNDAVGSSWSKAVADNPAGRKIAGEFWWKIASAGITNVNVFFAANANAIVRVRVGHDDQGGTWSLDQFLMVDGSGNAPSSGATGTTAAANELAFGMIGTGSSTMTWSTPPGVPWTLDAIVHSISTGANCSESAGSAVLSSTQALTINGALSASSAWVAGIVTFLSTPPSSTPISSSDSATMTDAVVSIVVLSPPPPPLPQISPGVLKGQQATVLPGHPAG